MTTTHLLKIRTAFLLAVLLGLGVTACKEDDPVLSSAAEITSFVFNDLTPPLTATITGTNITATVAYDQNITALTPTIVVSDKASVQPAGGVARDFSAPVTYTVTAEDGTTRVYTVTVTQDDPPVLAISAVWQRNLVPGEVPDWFTANNDRDITVAGDYVFVQNNNDKIRVVSAANGTDVAAGDTTFLDGKQNFSGGNLFLLGIDADNQGRIVGTNVRIGSDALNPWNVYVWNNKDADQELLFAYPTPAGFRLGENIAVVGDVRGNATIYVPGSGFGTISNKVLKFTIAGGTANLTPTEITLADLTNIGNAPDVNPVSDANDANLIVAGTVVANIAEYKQDGSLVGKIPAALNAGETAPLFNFALDAKPFELAGRKVIAATATDFAGNAANAGYLYLIDYTDGWDNLTAGNIKRVAFTPAGNIDTNFNGTGGVDVVVDGDEATVYAIITNFGIGAYKVTFE